MLGLGAAIFPLPSADLVWLRTARPMDSRPVLIQRIAGLPTWGYAADGPDAAEPLALATLALALAGEAATARRGAEALADMQATTGAVGPFSGQAAPSWPTAWAVLAWRALQCLGDNKPFADPLDRGVNWMLRHRSHTQPRPAAESHDTTLAGWPWAEGTHGWIEPTAMHVLALKSCGLHRHPRTREAVQMLLDRQLPGGGCNYGNTFVLDAQLLPHVQPTGLALWALQGEDEDPRVTQSLSYLRREWPRIQGTASRCFAMLGLAAHGQRPPVAVDDSRSPPRLNQPAGAYLWALQLLTRVPTQEWLARAAEVT